MRDPEDGTTLDPQGREIAPIIQAGFYATVELHTDRVFGAHHEPRAQRLEPVVGELLLPAGNEALREQAELVEDAVADGRQVERRQGVEEARCEPSEPAVAETQVAFVLAQRR